MADPTAISPVAMHCLQCGYPLHGVEHQAHPVCPECGRPFDPADPSTWLTVAQQRLGRWEKTFVVAGILASPGPLWWVAITWAEYLAAWARLGRPPQMYVDDVASLGPMVLVLHIAAWVGCLAAPLMSSAGLAAGVILLSRRLKLAGGLAVCAVVVLAWPAAFVANSLSPPGLLWWMD